MQVSEARLTTFLTGEWPLSKAKRKTGLTIEKLADAGFYFHPSKELPDKTTCYLCKQSLDSWKPSDDPLERHFLLNKSCPIVLLKKNCLEWCQQVQKGLRPFNPNDEDAPWSNKMQKAREATFGKWWKLEKDPESFCKIDQMAQAGFIYHPAEKGDDSVMCLHCSKVLGGWEPQDDPRIDHMRKNLNCVFLDQSKLMKKTVSRTKKGAPATTVTITNANSNSKKTSSRKRTASSTQRQLEDKEESSAKTKDMLTLDQLEKENAVLSQEHNTSTNVESVLNKRRKTQNDADVMSQAHMILDSSLKKDEEIHVSMNQKTKDDHHDELTDLEEEESMDYENSTLETIPLDENGTISLAKLAYLVSSSKLNLSKVDKAKSVENYLYELISRRKEDLYKRGTECIELMKMEAEKQRKILVNHLDS